MIGLNAQLLVSSLYLADMAANVVIVEIEQILQCHYAALWMVNRILPCRIRQVF
jgi:hypothetical protein